MENINEDNDNNIDNTTDSDDLLDEAAALSNNEPENDESFADETVDDETIDQAGPMPPTAMPYPAEDRLTRDPHATFGGVLSGIANRYGWDVSIVRLAFVVSVFATAGTMLLVYLLSWLIVPRAQYWPPMVRHRSQVSGRDLGIGLIALAALVALGIGAGQAAAVLVPLALIGGGIWLLVQNPREVAAPAMAFGGMSPNEQPVGPPPVPTGGYSQMPAMAPQPAPRRSRRGKMVLFGLLGAVLLIPALLIGGLILALTFGDPEITFGDGTVSEFSFDEISEIPTEINETAGSVIIDLSDVDFSSVDTVEERVELDINIEFGDLTVLLPEDVRVDVSADSFLGGDLTVFDQQAEGFSPELDFSEDDPQLILDIEVDSGKLTVKREISFTE